MNQAIPTGKPKFRILRTCQTSRDQENLEAWTYFADGVPFHGRSSIAVPSLDISVRRVFGRYCSYAVKLIDRVLPRSR